MQETIYVGLDMGSSRCQQAVIGDDGTLRFSRVVVTSERDLRLAFEGLEGNISVHLEAGELSAWAAGIIKPLVNRVVVSHPRTLAWIARDPLKSDKRDAAKLAELLRLGRVHEVYYETDNNRQTFKHLVVHYEMMSREQARQKSKIKARLRTLGIIRKDAGVFAESGQSELFALIASDEIKRMIGQMFAVLNQMIDMQTEAKHSMLTAAKQFPEVVLLEAVPGVGPITACRFVGYVQTPKRFSNKRKFWRYCRLGITRRESNGKRLSHPRLDNAGNGSLKNVARKVFEAARRTKKDNLFKRAYEQSLANTRNEVHARLSTRAEDPGDYASNLALDATVPRRPVRTVNGSNRILVRCCSGIKNASGGACAADDGRRVKKFYVGVRDGPSDLNKEESELKTAPKKMNAWRMPASL